MNTLYDAFGFFVSQSAALLVSALTLIIVALLANFRDQLGAGLEWFVAPLSRFLPWDQHRLRPAAGLYGGLVSQFTLVEVFLSADGKSGRYQKISNYQVTADSLRTYQEGSTCSGKSFGFKSMRGHVVTTAAEHGFWVSAIDLDEAFSTGSHFTNMYSVDLCDCFPNKEEHWTQEVAYPTRHLAIQIHFPLVRPPRQIACKVVVGTSNREITTEAKIVDLFGAKSIVWEIAFPKLHDIYKLEWQW